MEIIWTQSATEDYLSAEVDRFGEFAAGIDGALNLLRAFPRMGSPARQSLRLRRILVGKRRHFGIYYGLTENRIIVVALINLRQDEETITEILQSRQP